MDSFCEESVRLHRLTSGPRYGLARGGLFVCARACVCVYIRFTIKWEGVCLRVGATLEQPHLLVISRGRRSD